MTNRVAWLCSTVSPTRRTTKAKGDLDPSTPCHYAVYGGRNRLLTQATSVPQSTENIPLFPWQPYYVYYSHQHKPVCRSVQPTVLSHGYSFRSNLLYAICLNNSFFFFLLFSKSKNSNKFEVVTCSFHLQSKNQHDA